MVFSSLWTTYSQQIQQVRLDLQLGQYQEAAAAIPESTPSDNNFLLDRLESGRIAFLAQNWSGSMQAFDAATSQLDWLDQQAQYRISHGLEEVSALFSNDQAIAYFPPDYEQALLHHYQALNYLFQNKNDDALVELRKANQVQERALENRDRALAQARQDAVEAGVVDLVDQAAANLPKVNADGRFKGRVQSVYTTYLSALLYEAKGDLNDAYVDYRRAYEVIPDNPFLQQDLVRVTGKMGLTNEWHDYQKKFAIKGGQPDSGSSSGQVVVMSELGLIPQTQEIYLPIPVISSNGSFKSYTLALPYYPSQVDTSVASTIQIDGVIERQSVLMSFNELAAYSLQERLPGIITRQLLRLGTKEWMRHEAAKKGGDLGGLLVGVYNMLSEHADTRSWSTLPSDVWLWRGDLAPGNHAVMVGGGQVVSVPVAKNKTTLVWVQQSGSRPVAVVRQIS
jgi:Uncharacterized protein conserved in bacteria